MKPLPALLLIWILTGIGAVGGSILGNGFGRTGLFAGATLGGAALAALGAMLAVRLGWLPATARRAAAIGAVVGFLLAAPIAVSNLHTPITPGLLTSLAGVGALVGVGVSAGLARRD